MVKFQNFKLMTRHAITLNTEQFTEMKSDFSRCIIMGKSDNFCLSEETWNTSHFVHLFNVIIRGFFLNVVFVDLLSLPCKETYFKI